MSFCGIQNHFIVEECYVVLYICILIKWCAKWRKYLLKMTYKMFVENDNKNVVSLGFHVFSLD